MRLSSLGVAATVASVIPQPAASAAAQADPAVRAYPFGPLPIAAEGDFSVLMPRGG